MNEAADFKSAVSTYFTIEAVSVIRSIVKQKRPEQSRGADDFTKNLGGVGRSRTDLHGFAIRCITALLPRHQTTQIKKGSWASLFEELEREKSLELSTSTLARLRSTN
jgi:hypothetical protein